MFNHSKECTVPLVECQSSHAALVMGSSWSPFWFPLCMLNKIFCFTLISSTPFRAHTTRNSGQRRTMFSLLEALFLWSALLDSVSSLPIVCPRQLSQTSFSHISTNSSTILTVSMAMESPWKDLLIDTSHASKQSVLAKILGRSTGNHYGTVY